MEPERLGHGDALGGPARLLASTVRSRVRSWSTEGGHGQAPQGSRVACPGSTDMPGTRQQERGRPRLLLRLPREAGMIPSGNGARRGAQDRLRCPPTLGPVTLGLPSLRARRISLLPGLPVPAAAAGPPAMPCCFVREPQRLFVCPHPLPPASPGLRGQPGAWSCRCWQGN